MLNIRVSNSMPYFFFIRTNVHLWPKAPALRGKLSASAIGMGEKLVLYKTASEEHALVVHM